MLQFTQKLRRLETMKVSKFVWSVLVVSATVALIAPQQVEAIIVDGRVSGQTVFSGSGTITESSGINGNVINGNVINELDFNGQDFTYNLTVVTTSLPEGGSGLGLLAIGLVAVEGLRRKITTRQNRYA